MKTQLAVILNGKVVAYPGTEESAKEFQSAHPGSTIERVDREFMRRDFEDHFTNWVD